MLKISGLPKYIKLQIQPNQSKDRDKYKDKEKYKDKDHFPQEIINNDNDNKC